MDGEGICVSLWTQGCPHKCKGCHNPETWDWNGGIDVPNNIEEEIIEAIRANGVQRNFSVLGGEPLTEANQSFVRKVLIAVRAAYPDIKIFLWTGYVYERLTDAQKEIINLCDVLIDGPYIDRLRDITLHLRGSSNQRVIDIKKTSQEGGVALYG